MRASTSSSAARRSLLFKPLLPATRLASTIPSSSAPSSRAAASSSPLRSLLAETAHALSSVDELTRADSAWQRRLERALTRFDERAELARPRIVLGPARNAVNAPKQVSPLKREVTGALLSVALKRRVEHLVLSPTRSSLVTHAFGSLRRTAVGRRRGNPGAS